MSDDNHVKVLCDAWDGNGRIELFDDFTIRITHECGHMEASFKCNPKFLRRFILEAHEKLGP